LGTAASSAALVALLQKTLASPERKLDNPQEQPDVFRLIETHIQSIVGSIPAAYVRDYDWLVENINRAGESEYQSKYRAYWAMNAARLSPSYYQEYFGRLATAKDSMPTLGSLVEDSIRCQLTGTNARVFSFRMPRS
jgi:hypothetical protein